MSNLNQFFSKSFPLGAALSGVAYQGNVVTAEDGSVWIAAMPSSAFAYTSTYTNTPNALKTPHALITGPSYGYWFFGNNNSVAYKAASTLYCTGGLATALDGDSTNGYIYYTSADDGATWTARTFPNNKAYQVAYTAGKFIGVAASSTTNGVITSTDAVTWSSVTGVSMTIGEINSDGGNNIIVYPSNGTAGASSTDGGATFSSATFTSTNAISGAVGSGYTTWNAGASLFIAPASTAGTYQTSPTGATWTNRNAQATYLPYSRFFGGQDIRFASDATTTLAIGRLGFFATTTDGLTWSNHGFISSDLSSSPAFAYHDGTRFVVAYTDRVFYSTNATTWTEGRGLALGSGSNYVCNGRVIRTAATVPCSAVVMTDVTATSAATICAPTSSVAQTCVYYRIK